MPYITSPGQIVKYVYLLDTKQFSRDQQTSIFIYWDGNICLLMDVGTSNDIEMLFVNLKKMGIPLNKVIGIVVTHYHFDHAGGVSELWKKLSKQNPDFKIFVPKETCHKLQNAKSHIIGAKTTYGDKVGSILKLPPNAYSIVEKDVFLPIKLADGYRLQLTATPGHTDDHCAPTLFQNDTPIFCFAGESCGALCIESTPVFMPTSMPPGFHFEKYMDSCRKIVAMAPENLGFCHFGAIVGKKKITKCLLQHQKDMVLFRDTVIRAYEDQPDTRYVVKQVIKLFKQQGKISRNESEPNSPNVIFAITFGMMIDLGYRKPKYEQP
ncbi:MAG: MBL fold metallo-hydrolase [Desulfobacula sp.]|nr:MBL fold metallo-hydrolase [Desulfobacula sp.]